MLAPGTKWRCHDSKAGPVCVYQWHCDRRDAEHVPTTREVQPPGRDLVIANGRVIDPEAKLDAVRNVGIKDGEIAAISETPLNGQLVVDAVGLIVAPGFIDWHAHGQNTLADRVQAFDGVTTALEFEAGMLPIGRWYELQENKRVLNYGASSSWAIARIVALEGTALPQEPRAASLFANFGLKKNGRTILPLPSRSPGS